MNPKDEEPKPYCGPTNEALETPFNPWHDIWPGSWVLLKPKDLFLCLVWQERAASVVCREDRVVNLGRKFLFEF